MKRFLAVLTALTLVLSSALVASAQEQQKQMKIVVTTFPLYDWVRNILGDRLAQTDLTLLQDTGVDLHNYQPTAADFVKLTDADVFVYVGGESDAWVADAIKTAQNRRLLSVSLVDVLGGLVKNELVVEGMQEGAHAHDHEEADHDHAEAADADHAHEEADHDHAEAADADHAHEEAGHEEAADMEHDHEHEEAGHDHEEAADMDHDHEHEEADHDHEHEHEHEGHGHEHGEPDEHVWLSLRNAQAAVSFLKDILAALDETNAPVYEANAQAYIEKLKALDAEYTQTLSKKQNPVLLFADRFPFRYLMDDYGIGYYAAFSGCSAETEASFSTVAFLAGKLDELSLPSVMTIDGSDQKVAKTVMEASKAKNQKLLVLNSMQTITRADIDAGADYLDIMRQNLEVLNQAL